MITTDEYREANEKVNQYLRSILGISCRRCHLTRNFSQPHHAGEIFSILEGKVPISLHEIEKFESDAEHGLFHGMMVGFFASLVNPACLPTFPKDEATNKSHWKDLPSRESTQGVVSCILHDFLKATRSDPEEHDSKLRAIFPHLSEDTYTHANPDELSTLVTGDRIELYRYPRAHEWVDKEKAFKNVTAETKRLAYIFFKHIRPALLRFWEGKDEYWICHGPEKPMKMDLSKNEWPELKTLKYEKYSTHQVWPAEIGKMPDLLRSCLDHGATKNIRKHPWHGFQGIAPITSLQGKCKVLPYSNRPSSNAFKRDHPFYTGATELSAWLFTYDRQVFRHEWGRVGFQKFLDAGVPLVEKETLTLLHSASSLFLSRVVAARCSR